MRSRRLEKQLLGGSVNTWTLPVFPAASGKLRIGDNPPVPVYSRRELCRCPVTHGERRRSIELLLLEQLSCGRVDAGGRKLI